MAELLALTSDQVALIQSLRPHLSEAELREIEELITGQTAVTDIEQYADDPWAFQRDIILPIGRCAKPFGELMVAFQRERFDNLNPALLALANGRKPKVGCYWWEATKGCSKDTDLAVCILWLAAFSKRPLTIQVGAADGEQAGELRKAASAILYENPWLNSRVKIDKWQIKGPGGECQIIAADVAGSHGARPDVAVINELSHITKQEFAENLIDNTVKVPDGLTIVATNAGYLGTWQNRWREIALNSLSRWRFEQWAKPSPWLDPTAVEEAKLRNTSSRFMRLYYGVWSSLTGDCLDPETIEEAIVLDGPMRGSKEHLRRAGWTFLSGLDMGVTHDHSSLVTVGIKQGSNRITLVDCQNWAPINGREIDYKLVQQGVMTTHQRYGIECLYYDPAQMVGMSQDLTRAGVKVEPMNFVGKNLNIMASTLLDVFNMRMIELYNDERLIRDLQRLNIVEKSYGYKLESTRDADGHADRATALAIVLPAALLRAHQKGSGTVPNISRGSRTVDPGRHGVQFNTPRGMR